MANLKYVTNVHLMDKQGDPVPGARIALQVNGQTITSLGSSGRSDRPARARYNTTANAITFRAVHRKLGTVSANVAPGVKDVTLQFSKTLPGKARNMPKLHPINYAGFAIGVIALGYLVVSPDLFPLSGTVAPEERAFRLGMLRVVLALAGAAFTIG